MSPPAPGASPLAAALSEALPRLCGDGHPDRAVVELIGALSAALERGALELSLAGAPPPQVDPEGWPERHRTALAASPLVADQDPAAPGGLAARPEAPPGAGRLRAALAPLACPA